MTSRVRYRGWFEGRLSPSCRNSTLSTMLTLRLHKRTTDNYSGAHELHEIQIFQNVANCDCWFL